MEFEARNTILRHFNLFFVDLTALTVKVIAVTLTIEVPVKAADTAENVSLRMETVFNNFFQCYIKRTCFDSVTSEVEGCLPS